MAHISLLLLIFRFFIGMFVPQPFAALPAATPDQAEVQAQAEKNAYYAQLLTAGQTQPSPSGKYVLEYVSYDADGQIPAARFDIYTNDEAHTLVYASPREVMRRFNHFIFWDENPDIDRVWLYDSDQGLFYTEEADGEWVERDGPGGEEVPALLRALRPSVFPEE